MLSKPKYLELAVTHGPDTGRTRVLREGTTVIGSSDTDSDLTLRGLRIQPRHLEIGVSGAGAVLTNLAGGATLLQRANDPGSVVTGDVTLEPGDTLQIGEETLVAVSRSKVAVEKTGAGAGGLMEGYAPLIALGGALYLGVGVWWFALRETPAPPRALYLSQEEIVAYGAAALDCAAAVPVNAAMPPRDIDLIRAPDGAWKVLTSTAATPEAREGAARALSEAVQRDLAAGESFLRLGDRAGARRVYGRIDDMVPAPPLARDGEARIARCGLKRFVQGRLAGLRPTQGR